MSDKIEQAFRFQPLTQYSFAERLQIRAIGLSAYVVIKLIGMTIKFEEINGGKIERIQDAGHLPIMAFWHDRIVTGAYYFRHRRLIVLSSLSFDSEYTARVIQRLGIGIVKGSSTRGGVSGLVGMIRMMKRGLGAAFTVDGPKGPKYEVKAGPVLLAKKTGNPLMPFVIECRSFWRLKSWDRLHIPKPFTPAAVIFGDPIYVDAETDDDGIEAKRMELQHSLDALVRRGEQWRLGS